MKKILTWFFEKIKNYWKKLSFSGLFWGSLFFYASLTPSLLPRTSLLQGALSGLVFAVGYGIGCSLAWIWKRLELPELFPKNQKVFKLILTLFGISMSLFALGRFVVWQNSILKLMNQAPISNFSPLIILFLTIILFFILLGISRLLRRGFGYLLKSLYKVLPKNVSRLIVFLSIFLFIFLVINGVLGGFVLDIVDSMYAKADALTDNGVEKPTDSNKTGSNESLVSWETLGRQGRNFIVGGPSKENITTFSNKEAKEPIRVYVGLNSKDTTEERAQLALEELKRVGAFDRSVLIVLTPTGTGWTDSYSTDVVEYMHNGDTAIAAVQYSYLQSPIALITAPKKPQETAQALFHKIYTYWTTLPKNHRPKIYLNGVSLGSFGSESSFKLHEIIDDPIQGALWAGPPFVSKLWLEITSHRNPDSPLWMPNYEDGSFVRFTGQENHLDDFGSAWGPIRVIYLQYASDPIVFFSINSLYKKPAWLIGEVGPDISPFLQWRPGITFFQLLFDLIVSLSAAPLGHGHNYSPVNYVDSWAALSDPSNWSQEKTDQLKAIFN